MSIKTIALAAAAAVTLAVPAAAFAHDYQQYDRGDYGYSHGYRHEDGDRYAYGSNYGYRYDDGYGRRVERERRAQWNGPARYREHDGWRGSDWRYGDQRRYDRD